MIEDKIELGTKCYSYVDFVGMISYECIELRTSKETELYVFECCNCNTNEKCKLLLTKDGQRLKLCNLIFKCTKYSDMYHNTCGDYFLSLRKCKKQKAKSSISKLQKKNDELNHEIARNKKAIEDIKSWVDNGEDL